MRFSCVLLARSVVQIVTAGSVRGNDSVAMGRDDNRATSTAAFLEKSE